jgi:ribokinase
VDVTSLTTLPGVATGVALITVDAFGENAIAVASGANGAVTEMLVEAAFERIRPGFGDVVLLSHEIPTATVAAALRRAREAGATSIVNPAPVGDLDDPTLRLADVITPNRGELAALAGGDGDPATLAVALRDRLGGATAVLVSMGRDGAILVGADAEAGAASDAVHRSAALDVIAVDTVGAGDTLNGALAAGLAAGLGLRTATDRAVIAASLAVTRHGARAGMPTLAEVLAVPSRPD